MAGMAAHPHIANAQPPAPDPAPGLSVSRASAPSKGSAGKCEDVRHQRVWSAGWLAMESIAGSAAAFIQEREAANNARHATTSPRKRGLETATGAIGLNNTAIMLNAAAHPYRPARNDCITIMAAVQQTTNSSAMR